MQIFHRRHALRLAGASALLGLATLATSQPARADAAWPTRPITFVGRLPPAYEWTKRIYEKLGSGDRIRVIKSAREWMPMVK